MKGQFDHHLYTSSQLCESTIQSPAKKRTRIDTCVVDARLDPDLYSVGLALRSFEDGYADDSA